jgi:hypothetical protein
VHRLRILQPRRPYRPRPCLTFAPLAWLKLQFLCHFGETEVGGFGLSAGHDLLYVEDFVTVRQQATPLAVRFDDTAVADYFDASVDRGLHPSQFARLWCHTHPGASVTPSGTDETTFARRFGRCDWAVMFILGRAGNAYARLTFTAGPGAEVELPVEVDWPSWPECLSDPDRLSELARQWQEEYAANVHPVPSVTHTTDDAHFGNGSTEGWEHYPWCPDLDLVTYEPVEEVDDDEPGPRPGAA